MASRSGTVACPFQSLFPAGWIKKHRDPQGWRERSPAFPEGRKHRGVPEHFFASLLTTTLCFSPALPPWPSHSPSLVFVFSSMKGRGGILKPPNGESHTQPGQQMCFEGFPYCFVLFCFCICISCRTFIQRSSSFLQCRFQALLKIR